MKQQTDQQPQQTQEATDQQKNTKDTLTNSPFAALTVGYIRRVLTTDYADEHLQQRPCNYAWAKACLWHVIKTRMKEQGRQWQGDMYNRYVIYQLLAWLIGQPAGSEIQDQVAGKIICELDPNKGVLIEGRTGVGKTFLLECIAVCAAWFGIKNRKGRFKNIANESRQCEAEKSTLKLLRFRYGNIYIDDIGSEKDFKVFMENHVPLELVLPNRKEVNRQFNLRTCGTTNVPFFAYAYGGKKAKDALPEQYHSENNWKLVEQNPLDSRNRTTFRELFQPIMLKGEAKV